MRHQSAQSDVKQTLSVRSYEGISAALQIQWHESDIDFFSCTRFRSIRSHLFSLLPLGSDWSNLVGIWLCCFVTGLMKHPLNEVFFCPSIGVCTHVRNHTLWRKVWRISWLLTPKAWARPSQRRFASYLPWYRTLEARCSSCNTYDYHAFVALVLLAAWKECCPQREK